MNKRLRFGYLELGQLYVLCTFYALMPFATDGNNKEAYLLSSSKIRSDIITKERENKRLLISHQEREMSQTSFLWPA